MRSPTGCWWPAAERKAQKAIIGEAPATLPVNMPKLLVDLLVTITTTGLLFRRRLKHETLSTRCLAYTNPQVDLNQTSPSLFNEPYYYIYKPKASPIPIPNVA